jgi:hypothetical protein
MKGESKNIRLSTNNGGPPRSSVGIELDHRVPLTYGRYDTQLLVPSEFAALLEVGLRVILTLEQNGK